MSTNLNQTNSFQKIRFISVQSTNKVSFTSLNKLLLVMRRFQLEKTTNLNQQSFNWKCITLTRFATWSFILARWSFLMLLFSIGHFLKSAFLPLFRTDIFNNCFHKRSFTFMFPSFDENLSFCRTSKFPSNPQLTTIFDDPVGESLSNVYFLVILIV